MLSKSRRRHEQYTDSDAGSEGTVSEAADQAMAMSGNDCSVISPKPDKQEVASANEKFVYFESQQSMDNQQAKPRKASHVEKPIYQCAKKQKTKKENNSASANPAPKAKKAQCVTRAAAKAENTKSKFRMMK